MRIRRYLKHNVFNGLQLLLRPFGYSIEPEFDIIKYEHFDIIRQVLPYTKTSPARLFALIEAIKYVIRSDIKGDIVECGVWRGGSMMAVALALSRMGTHDRDLFLYDTYEGMVQPSEADVSTYGQKASETYLSHLKTSEKDSACNWCFSSLEEVKRNMQDLGYPTDKIFFIKGKVEETIPQQMPGDISILRLDTDFYESTKHELEYLFPRVSEGGVIIIDDYGHWLGQKKAVDEYIQKHRTKILLHRIDYTCRVGIKMS